MTTNYPNDPDGATAAAPGGGNGGSSGAKEQAKEQARQVAGTAADQGRQVAGTAADEARHVAGVAQGEAARVASEASSAVRDLVSQATAQVEDQSRTQLGRLAGTLRSLGEDLERMASQGEGPATGLAHEAADRTRGLAARLEGREPRDVLEDVRGFARRRPGVFLAGSLVAGVVAGRLTRGAKAAQDGSSSGAPSGSLAGTARRDPQSYVSDSAYDSPRASDVTSPGQPLSTGYAAPSSGPVLDTSTQAHGTASGEPLAGTGTPQSQPVYPGGVEDGRA
jgi:hypothetical protein